MLRNGFDPGDNSDPIRTFVYTAFQERATRISHQNVSLLAEGSGIHILGRVCRLIAADETRHEEVYSRLMAECFRLLPERALAAYADMMRSKVVMPGFNMGEEGDRALFEDYAAIAETSGIYTPYDYVAIVEHLNARWTVGSLKQLRGRALADQDYLCTLPARLRLVLRRRKPPQVSESGECAAWILP